jgi:L,D-transpeptidase catalytic domain
MVRWACVLTLGGAVASAGCRTEATRNDGTSAPALAQMTPVAAVEVEPAAVEGLNTAIVALDGSTHPHAVTLVDDGKERVYSRSLRTRIHRDADGNSAELGYLRAGGSAPVSGPARKGPGCTEGWVPVLPQGFVCLGKRATLDARDPVVRMSIEHPPDFGRKLPYIYGTVRSPGPEYARLPDAEQARQIEPDLNERMPRWLNAEGEVGASYGQEVWLGGEGTALEPKQAWAEKVSAQVPDFLSENGTLSGLDGRLRDADQVELGQMRAKTGYALLETFLWQGRRFGLTPEAELLPTDRLRPIRGSDFHGVQIGSDVRLPFAFVRTPAARYRDGAEAPYRAVVQLTGKQQFFDGNLHYETQDGRWLSDRVASRLDAAKKIPGWGLKGEKWIDVNLTKQTLMLYEGQQPVYATLISSGEAGLEDAETTTATKRGIFRIHTKHVSATMSSREIGEEFELRDVPYVMYFEKGGYALHGAYWHDRFGTPRSHGCINLAPEDARRIFHWTLPALPAGWHGVLSPLTGTVVFVHP